MLRNRRSLTEALVVAFTGTLASMSCDITSTCPASAAQSRGVKCRPSLKTMMKIVIQRKYPYTLYVLYIYIILYIYKNFIYKNIIGIYIYIYIYIYIHIYFFYYIL